MSQALTLRPVELIHLAHPAAIRAVHPDTGDDLKDHTDHALWLGEMLELDLSALS